VPEDLILFRWIGCNQVYYLYSPLSFRLLWLEEPFRRRKQAKHVVHKANNMSLHFGWTRGANKVVFGPKYHW
jgi:hypothetical protein